jgi:flagellar basal-body rod modification protein FlgD
MQVTSTANVSNEATSPDTIAGGPQQTLNQQDFLQLLVAQMQNQDPLNPQSDTDMAAQMAQFTSLTQSSAMSSSLSMLQANSLIGSTVTLQVDPQTTANGVVQGVILNGGTPQIIVNGSTYDLSQITGVTPTVPSSTTTSTPAAN